MPAAEDQGPGAEPAPHVNKRLKPGYDASPRAWGRPPGTPDELARGSAFHAANAPMSMHGLLNPNATPMASPVHAARGLGAGMAPGDAMAGRIQRPPGSPISLVTGGRQRLGAAAGTAARGGGSLYTDK